MNDDKQLLKECIDVITLLRSIILEMDNKYFEDHQYIIDTSKDFIDSLKENLNDN